MEGGRRTEIDGRLKAWEDELEALRVRLGTGPDSLHAAHGHAFQDLYRRKEVLRSRWEAIRGVYRPEASAVQGFEAALSAMEEAWATAMPMRSAILTAGPPGPPG